MDDPNFPQKTKRELLWFSTFIFVLTVLIIRIVINLQAAAAMSIFDLGYAYQPFGNLLEKGGWGSWTDSKVIFVFAIGPFLAFLAGLILIRILKKNKYLTWKSRLILTWQAFVFIHLLPFGMMASVFFHNDFGNAFTDFFISPLIMFGLSLAAIALAVYFRPFWLIMFLKASRSHRVTSRRSMYYKFVFIRPWMLGTLIITAFAFVGNYWAWLTTIILMGFVVLPFFNLADPMVKVKLSRTGNRYVFKNIFTIVLYAFIIIALFAGAIVMMVV